LRRSPQCLHTAPQTQVGTTFNATNFTAWAELDIVGLTGAFPSLVVFNTSFTLSLNESAFKVRLYAQSKFNKQNPWSLTAYGSAILDMFGTSNMKYSGDFSAYAKFKVRILQQLFNNSTGNINLYLGIRMIGEEGCQFPLAGKKHRIVQYPVNLCCWRRTNNPHKISPSSAKPADVERNGF
jgi:hypothetical protein